MFSHSRGLASKLFVFLLSNAYILPLRLLRFLRRNVHDWIYLRERKKMDLVPLDIPLRRPVNLKPKSAQRDAEGECF